MRRSATLALALLPIAAGASDLLQRLPLEHGRASVTLPASRELHFLEFGAHRYAPADLPADAVREPGVILAPFQGLRTARIRFPGTNDTVTLSRATRRDAFWDQIITVDPAALAALTPPRYRVIESGEFAAVLPPAVRAIDRSDDDVARQRASLVDPIIPRRVDREIPWAELERAAWPLDFQKVLIAGPHDASPAFAFQNGQWFTTWLSRDLPKWNKEDHWFAPALLIGDTLIRPAPLSAKTAFLKTAAGVTLPMWMLEWSHGPTRLRQELFSHRSRVFVRFELHDAPAGAQLALGTGRRPNVHYWDDTKRERTPLPFFTLEPKTRREGNRLVDHANVTLLSSPQPFTVTSLGPFENLLAFAPDVARVTVITPQVDTATPIQDYDEARAEFIAEWTAHLTAGAQVKLPSPEWQERIDVWRAQVEQITRAHYQNQDRLSYGAYFYQAYFGIEEAWPVIALAQWGQPEEAKRQAEIMLRADNLDKTNVHHQSRNGIAPLAAATVALLTRDRAWLESIAPALLECARWTETVRHANADTRSPLTRGLLPPHIYGGDVRDPATSLYASAACWRGLVATAAAFRTLGPPELAKAGSRIAADAASLRGRIDETIGTVTVRDTTPPFVPFALELPSLAGRHEGPHSPITATRFGNYWNLFAPSFLELGLTAHSDAVFDYAEAHGGLWAGLPRFYEGLDAAYAVGNIAHLIARSVPDIRIRPQAIASLHAFMLHAASRNGHAIPEVAGLFPYRLQRAAFEQITREAPWNFGMYDAHRYLEGHISFTEPLGAGAGEALSLIRHALVSETLAADGVADGGLMLFPAIPSDWLAAGRTIELRNWPTFYGLISVTVRSTLARDRTISVEHHLRPFAASTSPAPPVRTFRVRLVPPGLPPQELALDATKAGTLRARW